MTDESGAQNETRYGKDDYLLIRRNGAVAEVIFDRPEKLNALPMGHGKGLEDAFNDLSADETIKVILFRGNGRAFSTGGDMGYVGTQYDVEGQVETTDRKRRMSQRHYLNHDEAGLRAQRAILNCTKVVIAEGKGYVIGVAFALLMCADIIICEEGTVFGYPPSRMAGVPGNSVLWMLRLGPALSAEMTLMGRFITAEEGYERNFVNRVVPGAELDATVRAAAEAVCAIPADGLTIGKYGRKMAYATFGVDSGALQSALTHTLSVQLRYEDEEWNLMRERNQYGQKEASRRRDERFEEPLLRYNPKTPRGGTAKPEESDED